MSAKHAKVMLVTADAEFAGLLRASLAAVSSQPVDVPGFSRLDEALRYLACNQRVEVVFLDLFLPDSQGMETFSKVRASAPFPSVVILASPGRQEMALTAVQEGAQDYLLREECDARTLARLVRYAQERRRAQDELGERREFSRLISQNVTDLIMILDREGRRVYHSPSYKAILGDLELLKGSTAFLEIHPEDRDRVQQTLRESLATGVGQRLQFRFLLKDGTVRYIESQANVIRERGGKPCKMVVVSRDISDRQQAEQALRESEQRYKRLLGSTTDYIFTVKIEGGRSVATTHGAGCEALTGYKPEDFDKNSQLWLSVVPTDERGAVLEQVRLLVKGEVPPPLEHRLIRQDGRVRWIRNTSVPRKDEHGRLIAYDGLISDITERKQAEEQLKRAYAELAKNDEALRKTLQDLNASHQALKATQLQLIQAEKFESIGTLAAGVAHEVKNPLQTILMGLAYLKNNLPPENETFSMVLSDMRDAVKRADTIVRELLTLSAATHIEMKDEDFNAVLERSLWLVNYQINSARVHVVKELAGDLPLVHIDRSRLEQVFLNLFLNAVQAMPNGGTLKVRTRLETWAGDQPHSERSTGQFKAGETVLAAEVQDTGVGIPAPNLLKVFDPFFTTKPVGSGTGLGLSVAKQIIDLHGGSINVQNAPEGGVRVTVILRTQPATTS